HASLRYGYTLSASVVRSSSSTVFSAAVKRSENRRRPRTVLGSRCCTTLIQAEKLHSVVLEDQWTNFVFDRQVFKRGQPYWWCNQREVGSKEHFMLQHVV